MSDAALDLRCLLAPRSVAVVGATERRQHGGVTYRNLLQGDIAEAVFPVNPRYDTLDGRACYPDIKSLPVVPDCAVFAVPAAVVPAALEEAADAGVRAAVVLSSGFAEAGPDGRARQQAIAAIARAHGMAVCGPNCMGVVNVVDRLYMYTAKLRPDLPRGNVGVVAQSGSVTYLLLHAARVACSYAISSGNQAVLDATDYLAWLVEDADTQAIALFVEAVPQPERFLAAVGRAHALGKPIVALKPGRSERAARAALAHTGTLAGSHEVFAAICRQYGVVQVNDLDEMVEVLALFADTPRRAAGGGLGIANYSGGENALVMDIAEAQGLALPPLSAATVEALRKELPPFAAIGNPLDVTGALYYNAEGYRRCVETLARDPALDMVVTVQDMPGSRLTEDSVEYMHVLAEATIAATRVEDKPVALLTSLSGDFDAGVRARLQAGGVPVLEGAGKGLQATRRFLEWSRASAALRAGAPADAPAPAEPPAALRTALAAAAGRMVGEVEAKAVLATLGLPVVREARADTVDAAVAAAAAIGYPVALKVDSPDILHKTDVGGVALGLADADAVRRAFRAVHEAARAKAPGARIDGVVVQEMVAGGREVALGMKRDPEFGPIVMLALGGVLVEAMKALVLRRAPLDHAGARGMIDELPGRQVLEAFRGAPPGDLDALAQLIVRFSQFAAAARDALAEVDLNPVLVLPAGRGVRIVDALFVPYAGSAAADRPAAG